MAEKQRNGRIVTVWNQKGGVGKTTTAVNLAAGLNLAGYRTLLVDFDPQANATSAYGIAKSVKNDIFSVMDGRCTVLESVIETRYGDLLPSGLDLAGAEVALVGREDRENVLKLILDPLRERYDFILIDPPPSLTLLTINVLSASDSVLIPLQCEYFALEGLSMLVSTVKNVKKRINPNLEIEGILFTMYDGRTNLSGQIVREVKRYFPDRIYKTVISRSVKLSEAPSHGKPIQFYDKHSRGCECYTDLTNEFIKRASLR
ncbi:MAG: ParA family protein [Clostridia bacterium]|nr:ParA family protein [Clostridia bacterium]